MFSQHFWDRLIADLINVSASLFVFLITDLHGHFHQLAAEPAEEVVIFDLLLQLPDFVWITEPAAEGFTPDFLGEEGVRADQHRDIHDRPFGFKELTGDGASAHLLEGGDMAENVQANLTEFGELTHGFSLIVVYIQQGRAINSICQ